MPASNITPPALFRATELWKPTLLIDEADTFLKDNDELRGIVNSGHTRDMAFVIRTVGDDHEPKRFSTWAPKAIALIGKLSDTIIDRSIVIQMRRKTPGEKVDRLKNFDATDIKARCIRWAQDNEKRLRASDPELPVKLHDRAADNWTPLVIIADMAGGDWPELSRKAAETLTQVDENEDSIKIQLLADIDSILRPKTPEGLMLSQIDKIWTEDLLKKLYEIEERPWSDWKRGKALSARAFSQLLKAFGIRSRDIKIDGTNKKGYRLKTFDDAFTRYLPKQSATPLPASVDAPLSDIQSATPNKKVADRKPPKPAPDKESSGVADKNRGIGGLESNAAQVEVTL